MALYRARYSFWLVLVMFPGIEFLCQYTQFLARLSQWREASIDFKGIAWRCELHPSIIVSQQDNNY